MQHFGRYIAPSVVEPVQIKLESAKRQRKHIPKWPPSIPKEKFQYFELWQAQPRQICSKITLRWVNFEAPKGTECKQCKKMLQKLHHLSAAASSMQYAQLYLDADAILQACIELCI